jgi:Abortive infection alpha
MAPSLARLAFGAWWRTATWTADTSYKLARNALGMADDGGPPPPAPRTAEAESEAEPEPEHQSLRARGAELLRRSADVDYEEDAHPAYERILEDLAPDEARILRFLAAEGPQPAVDVRAHKALNVGSDLVAPGLSMIGAEAGTRYLDRVPAYLNNLYRLGLIWFSREPLEDPLEYQVLEAQPDVIEAMREAGRAKTVRRSIHLTPFGEDFCRVCLPG